MAAIAASVPIAFEPGTKASYSNVGIDIGAAIVEVITGKRWEDFLKERVLEPLGMTHSTFFPSKEQLDRKIEMYKVDFKNKAVHVEESPSMQRPYGDDRVFPSAGAGLWTTVRDQLKFYKMLMNLGIGENGVRILKEETVKSILAVSTRPKEMGGYSLGLNAPRTDSEDAWFGHGGAWMTLCSVNWHKRQLHLVAVQFLSSNSRIRSLNKEAADKFFKGQRRKDTVNDYTGRME